MNIPTTEDLKAVEQRLLTHIIALSEHVKDVYPKKRWLKSKEFMEHFDIAHPDTLTKMRKCGEVKARMKLGVYYYDKESFLPS